MTQAFAMMFPGQGSQHVGMLAELALEYPIVEETFREASHVLGYDVWQLAQQGPQEKLDQTEFTQPTLLTADVAIYRCWQAEQGPTSQFMIGHSLGEYAALVCTGALDFRDAVGLVAKRGRYMQEAVPAGEGAMGAVIGLDDQQLVELCQQAAQGEVVSPANFNSIGQTVISGNARAVDRVLAQAKAAGARMAKRIAVSVPSHCGLMQSAADRLADDLAQVNINQPATAVVHNVDVAQHDDAAAIREVLVEQLVGSVRWVETVQFIIKQGVTIFVEAGPGKKLEGLMKRIDRNAHTLGIVTKKSILSAVKHIKG